VHVWDGPCKRQGSSRIHKLANGIDHDPERHCVSPEWCWCGTFEEGRHTLQTVAVYEQWAKITLVWACEWRWCGTFEEGRHTLETVAVYEQWAKITLVWACEWRWCGTFEEGRHTLETVAVYEQ
jgi:hypothetical protein